MKKIYQFTMLLLVGAFALTACDDDNDSNPILTQPTSFVLNNPAITGNVDLQKSQSVTLTWSQPRPYTNFDAPVIPTYTVEISPTGAFNTRFDPNAEDNTGADYFAMEETYTSGQNVVLNTETINRYLMQMNKWEDPTKVPSLVDLAIRVKSAIVDGGFNEYKVIYSNVVNLKAVPYFMVLKPADPEIWWLIGADIADGSWGGEWGKCVIPMQTVDGAEYDNKTGQGELTWTGYLGGNGFKLVLIPGKWDDQWGQNDDGYVKNDSGSGNITVPEPGIYTVTLNTATNTLNVEKSESKPAVFSIINIAGTFNEWGDTPMTPCSTGWENHDWYIKYNLAAGDKIKFKDNTSSWDYNRGGTFINREDGMYGYGTQGGADLVIDEGGEYLIFFNDITGYYRFIKQ
ncbi:MAG: SusF/SusE family outer membrane protein [Prevotella sp.]|nr:SusF/SusE family outer membrane protein [Prevotella sp.]